jgi:hypothetical protein
MLVYMIPNRKVTMVKKNYKEEEEEEEEEEQAVEDDGQEEMMLSAQPAIAEDTIMDTDATEEQETRSTTSSAARKCKISTTKDDSTNKDRLKKKPCTSSWPAKKTEDDKVFKMPKGVILSNGEALNMDVDENDLSAGMGKKCRWTTGMKSKPATSVFALTSITKGRRKPTTTVTSASDDKVPHLHSYNNKVINEEVILGGSEKVGGSQCHGELSTG